MTPINLIYLPFISIPPNQAQIRTGLKHPSVFFLSSLSVEKLPLQFNSFFFKIITITNIAIAVSLWTNQSTR